MGEAKRRKLLQTGDRQQKPTLPDLSKPRNWLVTSYNPHTDTYLIENVDLLGNVIVSCLKCHQKLTEGKIYKGFKDENRYFQVME
ncbi:MAG: hypothetical protein V7L26_15045 [Nostoc sp.]|uniref:hypothetical protein n=1 Tax=Nostoc sp. TaxID=1180 RepID=UPI002FF30AFC